MTRLSANRVAGNFALALGYFMVARISLLFAYRDLQITAVWLPSGIAMAAVLLYGPKALPGIVLGDLAAGLTFGTAPWVAVLVALAGALEAVVGARLLPAPQAVRGQGLIGVPQVLRFVLRGALIAPLASTVVGATALYLAGTVHRGDLPRAMAVWWTGDCVGILLVLPIVMLTVVRGRPPSLRRHGDIALLALTLGTAAFIFFQPGLARTSGNALGFLVFPLIVWCAFDFSASLLAATNLAVAIIALAGTSMGLGPYALANDMSDIWTLQAYVAAIATMSLMLRGAIEDRRRSSQRAETIEGHFLAAADAGAHLVLILQPGDDPQSGAEAMSIVYANRRARAAYRPGAQNGEDAPRLAKALPQFAGARCLETLDEVLRNGQSREFEYRYDDAAGRPAWFRCTAIALERGLMVMLLDITVQRQAQQRAEASEKARLQAEASARSKAMMMSYFAHEIGAPVNAVIGQTYLMRTDREHPLPPEQADRLARLADAGERVAAVMRDILDLQRMEAGRFEIRPEPVDVHAAARRAVEHSLPSAQAARVRLDLGGDPGAMAMADPARLQQCLLNLIGNGVRYNRAAGSVSVSVRRDGERVLVAVQDSGPGLTEEQMARLFEPFSRPVRRNDTAGTGIGLVITRLLMAAMGGSLEVSSRYGEGSCFTLGLPAAPSDVAAAP